MNTNIDRYKPKTYFAFMTNALRNNIGDGTLEFYIKYKSPLSSLLKEENPFNMDHPEFFYCDKFSVRCDASEDEIIHKAKAALGNMAITQRKNTFYREELILLLSCNNDGEFGLDVIYFDTHKWAMEPFEDLAADSDLTDKQKKRVLDKLTNFYDAMNDNSHATIKDLQEEYLT